MALVTIERDAILPGYKTLQLDRDAILSGHTSPQSDRDAILHGYSSPQSGRDFILAGYESLSSDRDAIMDAHPGLSFDGIITGKVNLEATPIITGIIARTQNRYMMLRGTEIAYGDRDFIIKGREDYIDREIILKSKAQHEVSCLLQAYEVLPPGKTKRLTLFDTLNLRTTSVYKTPRDISTLKIVIGDLSTGKVPCTPLDESGTVFHISDRPIQRIDAVYVEEEPKSYGYRTFPSWQDETGNAIACVIFDNPQYNKDISVSCKGIINPDSGVLIENPADIIRYLFLNIQGYDASSIDSGEISRFYADCLKEDLKLGLILDEAKTIKEFLDELAENIHARWMISDGKSVMRLLWL